jgi:CBS domain-containing protein
VARGLLFWSAEVRMTRQNDELDTAQGSATLLPVRTRRVVTAAGVRTSPPTVHCPRQRATVAADACFACGRFTGVAAAGRRAAVRCNGGAVTEPLVEDDPIAADHTPAEAIMARDVVCVTADLPIDALTRLLDDTGFGGVPVVDNDDVLVGMVSQSDLLTAAIAPRHTVADIMMPMAFSMNEQVPVGTLAAMMAYEGVHRIPIVDDDGKVVGLVSALDVVRWVAHVSGRAVPMVPAAVAR